ncbi:hypothetical protein CsSME_00043352 [Camellia sinensis var. sinensis]
MEDLPAGYRPNVGVCLINADDQIFVASRLNVPGAWQMPQGGIEEGEEPKSAAIRELQEETGIVSAEIISEVWSKLKIQSCSFIVISIPKCILRSRLARGYFSQLAKKLLN